MDTCLNVLRSHLTSKTKYPCRYLTNTPVTAGWSRLTIGSPLTLGGHYHNHNLKSNTPHNFNNLTSLYLEIILVSLSTPHREVSWTHGRRPKLPKAGKGRTSEKEGKNDAGLGLDCAYGISRDDRVYQEGIKEIQEEYLRFIGSHFVNKEEKQTTKTFSLRYEDAIDFFPGKIVDIANSSFSSPHSPVTKHAHLPSHRGKLAKAFNISSFFLSAEAFCSFWTYETIFSVILSQTIRSNMADKRTDDRLPFSPPSFRNFECAQQRKGQDPGNTIDSNSSSKEPKALDVMDNDNNMDLKDTEKNITEDADVSEQVSERTSPEKVSDPDDVPTKDVTETDETQGTSSPHPASCATRNSTLAGDHLCIHKDLSSSSVSASRHDQEEVSPRSDQTSVYDIEPGMILDKENEGDAELIRKCASGVSNITGDLDLLRPSNSDNDQQESNHEVNKSAQTDAVPSTESEAEKISKQDQAEPGKNPKQDHSGGEYGTDSDKQKGEVDEDTKQILEKERLYMEEVMKQTDEQHAAFDQAYKRARPDPDTSSDESHTYSLPHSPNEQGQAGLDPNISAEWVPSFIDPELNLSKSKKRRRRQQKKKEALKSQDNLSKLLSGRQTKEEAEFISTFDLGNQVHRRGAVDALNKSGVYSGNLEQERDKKVQDCEDERTFAATMNSTRYGPDFDDSESVLREGSEQEEMLKDDALDRNESENSAKDDPKHGEDKMEDGDESVSSNSTGARRKRKRNKKTSTKQTKSVPQAGVAGTGNVGRETRSKAHSKQQTASKGDDIKETEHSKTKSDIKSKDDENENKGEKEKNPSEPTGFAGSTAISLLPSPSRSQVATTAGDSAPCTRLDIQRVVSKAVNKSKFKTSNNFAFNSKIQNFKITTDGNKVKKFPVIDDTTPVVEVSVPEFIWADQDRTLDEDNMVNVKAKGVIQFVILVRNGHLKKEAWDTPKIETARDFASYLLCTIAELKLEFGTVLRWTNAWGNVAVMGLDSSDLDMLQKFRTFFTSLRYVHQYFNTFPKDALTNNFSLSILLRSDLREFREDYLAEALFARNNLVGILETLQAESFTASDTTRAGVSKKGWRNVTLEGDADFFHSLSTFTANHWFNIGPGTVQIHGGDRRAETPEEIEAKNKRKRFNMPIGQPLSQAAKTSINQSFLRDQQALIQAKKQRNAAPASTSPILGATRVPAPTSASAEK